MAPNGPYAMSDLSPEYAPKRTSADHSDFVGSRPHLIDWFWKQILRYTLEHFLGTNAHLLLELCRRDNARRSVMFGRQIKFQSERLMADVYLGIMIAGVNTLIVLGVALAFVVI